MNLYTYLNAKRIDAAQIPSCVFEPTKRMINQIRALAIPFAKQEQMIFKLLKQLNQNQDDPKRVLDSFQVEFEQEKRAQSQNKWQVDLWDAFMAISGCVLLFDIIFEQVIDHQNLMGMMDFGVSQLLSAMGLYLICRILIAAIIRFDQGIWRWISLAGLFCLFLAIRFLSNMAFVSMRVSVLVVALVFCFIFGLSLWQLNRFYVSRREEKRIQ